ncbi:hypothetical protein [Rhizobium leguminosarum]|uniref:hypothetical protein n=1 Tax=Rhizobium leguminosarum TaxID=384 RepID=UPI003F9AAEBC
MKLIYWDDSGLVMAHKRLGEHTFIWLGIKDGMPCLLGSCGIARRCKKLHRSKIMSTSAVASSRRKTLCPGSRHPDGLILPLARHIGTE